MVKCTFCGKEFTKGTGKMYVKSDGKIFYFCSNKCEKNQVKHKRKARTLKWTDVAAAEKKKAKTTAKK
jgi:large subunit ribosomal protein L24e